MNMPIDQSRAPGWRTEITTVQWLVLLGTTMGWALDGFAGSLYALVLGPAMTELLPNSGITPTPAAIGLYGGLTVACSWPAGRRAASCSACWPTISVAPASCPSAS